MAERLQLAVLCPYNEHDNAEAAEAPAKWGGGSNCTKHFQMSLCLLRIMHHHRLYSFSSRIIK